MANKRKTTTAIVAGVTAAALLLGGTFAWTSISQQAKNEAIVDINPGGRLHDDFDGSNKDVYVENFSSGATGVNIFARIRLDQYFEVGQDAGINKEESTRKVTKPLGDNTDINDVETWVTYKPVVDEEGNIDLSNPVQANDNWQWTLGNDDSNLPYYMPTFNKNKDSLAADINGTYEGTVEGDIVHYDDFVKYGTNTDANEVASLTQDAIYDWDEDTEDEVDPTEITDRNLPIDSADVLKEQETHEATQISTTATVISMAEWLTLSAEEQMGNFWVYDTDGWAYWAQPIEPGKTTGLLLDGINMSRVPDDNWYYGINVVGQFATASDWEMFFVPEEENGGGTMTDGAKQLMALITDTAASGDEGGNENPSVETPTYYTMDVAYPLESGTTVNLGVPDYTDETPEDSVSYYIINKANNPTGGSDTELEAKDGAKVVKIVFSYAGGLIQETKYYYAVPFANSSQVTTTELVEGVTFAALDGDTLVAYTCTKIYDATAHTYLGVGNYAYDLEGVMQNVGCLVFESIANPGNYCTLGDANVGVDGDDQFVVTTGVTAAGEDARYDYDVTTITGTACTCTASNSETN